ncbi:multidrug resistance-associated ABC transporter [Fomitiporia mediterranea MF3/22]|uniref:multidrug resistance-associated ABC transporter n=1 Tax=Fomitiporia mediterranea (strain MF3/22) TaxID=694068 RepID=UPI00044085F9|nr:multidrug resistance-associated ABC transporter [Fomitiporia mediterranea MF3/22]EJC98304.1 multidrug resistance-associated ABC transporter [Fomitiporia mediterranea MF3/22]
MPRYQLEVAIVLCCSALLSAAVFALQRRPKEGAIKLPLYDDGELIGATESDDPFNVTKPEDVIDGYPIREEEFWRKIRIRKLLSTGVTAALVIVQTVALGWTVIADENVRDVASTALYTAFSLYMLVLSVISISHSERYWHGRFTVHLAALSTTAVVFLVAVSILPSRVQWEKSRQITWFISLALWILAFWLSTRMKRGPDLHFPSERIYSEKTLAGTTTYVEDNVCGIVNGSPWDIVLFSYTTKVVRLGYTSESLEIGDLPIVAGSMRATSIFSRMKYVMRKYHWRSARPGSGWLLAYRILCANKRLLTIQISLVVVSAVLFYSPALFLRLLVKYLEDDPERKYPAWGWVYAAGLFGLNAFTYLVTGQLWSISTTSLQVSMKIQLNTILYGKTLVRKDVASTAATKKGDKEEEEGEFSSKAQVMTLMTTDVDRVSEFAWHFFALFDSPIEITIGMLILYNLLGVSCFIGLAAACLFLPMNHYASKVVVSAQENLMKARDERMALMNEVLSAIKMLKFMAWERNFESRVMKIREKELKYQRLNYIIETLFNSIWAASPLVVTLVSFWHFTVIRHQTLTPSIAFTSIAIFAELKFALNAIPETLINMYQSFVSMARIERYLGLAEVAPVEPLDDVQRRIALQSATITWPQDRSGSRSASASATPSTSSTPRRKFSLIDLTIEFPPGELSLICGKLGAGKTLLLLSLLGEADLLAGQISCPRSPPNVIASFVGQVPEEKEWIVNGVCAYVPQAAWLQNATIKENILFNLPFVEERYQKTLEACALVGDLKILEDGDESEIGERGVTLSGGQKARVSLARAVYSRASVLLLDDVLSAVDAHTAHHLYHECLKGDLMKGRTVILVSHHVQLCAPGASYIVSLDNGRLAFSGHPDDFRASGIMARLIQSDQLENAGEENGEEKEISQERNIEDLPSRVASSSASVNETTTTEGASPASSDSPVSETESTLAASSVNAAVESKTKERKAPRKLIEEEKRAVGRIGKEIWKTYFSAVGSNFYWIIFAIAVILAAASPVAENGWLSYWSGLAGKQTETRGPMFYVAIYALITFIGLIFMTFRWFVLYHGSIHASTILYKRLLETVLFAQIRFHDTVSRGRLLNRFGKDFEGIDSSLSDNFGRSVFYFISACTTLVAITYVGGPVFFVAALILGVVYYNVAKVYGQCSRDMRRLDSVSRSPLYSIYGETISGVPILRAFGASSKFLRDMLRCVDTNANPYYWLWGVNRWVSTRFNLLSSAIVGVTAIVALINPKIDASLAGFTLAFASTVTNDLLFMVRRFVGLEQSMVAVERVKEYSELSKEGPEFVEPRPPASWPSKGSIECEKLVIRYAPDLPDVLHDLNFKVNPGEKIGILGRTGSGKSTLALSFFRFVEPTEGRILVDGIDITKVGLTDLRSRLTIIPQDPTVLSGTLRSTLDVFDEYEDAEIFEALRRVHLIPSSDEEAPQDDEENENPFRNLDSPVSEGGDNFSTGQKQLLCMARAILKRSKILVMDEATASVDYATDELIGKTIRQEFADSTLLTIAHRLRTVIDYNRVMLLDQGRIVEYDRPATLLSNPSSRFYALCKAAGSDEFTMLKRMAGVS